NAGANVESILHAFQKDGMGSGEYGFDVVGGHGIFLRFGIPVALLVFRCGGNYCQIRFLSMARESKTNLRARAARIYDILQETYPDASCALNHKNPYQLLAATILSAQCTDARV